MASDDSPDITDPRATRWGGGDQVGDQLDGAPASESSTAAVADDAAAGAARDAVPSVLAVIVAHDPDEHFEETLEAFALQDYPRLAVVVLDAAGVGLDDRVEAVLPSASAVPVAGKAVGRNAASRNAAGRRVPAQLSGFAAAANCVLDLEVSAAFLLICHDDVAPAPNAISTMVVEALRSNAGVVGPKLVDWDHPEVLQHVGYEVDRFAVCADVVAPDELDQQQHDAVRDVFAVPSAVVMIRSDLFATLGGFDEAITFRGEDVDLCWRAHMAGARVIVVPDAVVRHREELIERRGVDDVRRSRARHSLRALLINHGRISLFLTLPMAALMACAEMAIAAATLQFGHVRDVASAWSWNLTRLLGVIRRRRANTQVRTVRQADVTALQYFGSLRVSAFVRGQIGRESTSALLGGARRHVISSLRTRSTLMAWTAWILVLGYVVYGSRTLIGSGVPSVGDFVAFPESAADLIRAWWSGWSERAAGAPSSNLTGLAWLGALGWLAGGGTGLLRTLWVLAPLLIGLIGAYRLLAVSGSRRAQVGSLVAYLVIPLAPAALATGSISGLTGYAVAPWILGGLLRVAGAAPFRTSASRLGGLVSGAVGVGAMAGLTAAFEPAAGLLMALIALGLAIGSLVAARPVGVLRLAVGLGLAAIVAALVAVPLLVDFVAAGPTWRVFADGYNSSAGSVSFVELLHFDVGLEDPGWFLWLLAVPAVAALLLSRGWRMELAIRLWLVALVSWGLALVAQLGWLSFGLGDLPLLLAPAAASVAALCGVAVLAVEHDLRFAGFGWRQALVPLALVASLLAALPSLVRPLDGRWGLTRAAHLDVLELAPTHSGDYRVLWIAAPQFLPVVGHSLGDGVAWAVTTGDDVTIVDRSAPVDATGIELFSGIISDISEHRTARAGRLLAGLGVRYVVLLQRLSPAPFSSSESAVPVGADLSAGLGRQLDLQALEGANSAMEVFVNTSWVPIRTAFAPGFDSALTELGDLQHAPLGAGAPVLVEPGRGASFSGSIPDSAEVLVTQTPDAGWSLKVDGVVAPRRDSMGWASVYLPEAGGEAGLSYAAPRWRQLAQLAGALAPLALAALWLRRRRGDR